MNTPLLRARRLLGYGLMALLGALGAGMVLLGLHLWQDHQTLHALIQIELRRQQGATLSAPPPGESR